MLSFTPFAHRAARAVLAAGLLALTPASSATVLFDLSSLAAPPDATFGAATTAPIDLSGNGVADSVSLSIPGGAFGGVAYTPLALPTTSSADALLRVTARLGSVPSDPGAMLAVSLTQPGLGSGVFSEAFFYNFDVNSYLPGAPIFFDIPLADFDANFGLDFTSGTPTPVFPPHPGVSETPAFDTALIDVAFFNQNASPQAINLDIQSVQIIQAPHPNRINVTSDIGSVFLPNTQVNVFDGGVVGSGSSSGTPFAAELNVYPGGSVGDSTLWGLGSVVNMFGGSIGTDMLLLLGDLNLTGGSIGDGLDMTLGTLDILGSQFILDGIDITGTLSPGTPLTVTDRNVNLSGVLSDGTPFSFDLNDGFSIPDDGVDRFEQTVITISLVPEPGSAALLAIALPLLGRRRR